MTRTVITSFVTAALLTTGCALETTDAPVDESVSGLAQATSKGTLEVTFEEVGYGGTGYLAGEKVIWPEYLVLRNDGDKNVNISGWYLTDGPNWGGDGLARFPNGTSIPAGGTLVVANYPPVTTFETYWGYQPIDFETAYGYAPDLEIAGSNPAIKDLEPVAGRIRLKHQSCSYDGDCNPVEEQVWLINGAELSDEQAVLKLEQHEPVDVVDGYPN